MKIQSTKKLWLSLSTLLVLSACAPTRYGQPVKYDSNGNLPPVTEKKMNPDQMEALYERTTLGEKLTKELPHLVDAWKKMREAIAKSPAKKIRIGRLLNVAAEDKNGGRTDLVRLWAIRYAHLDGEQVNRAADYLDQVLRAEDLTCNIHTLILFQAALPADHENAISPEKQKEVDQFFLRETEAVPAMPKADEDES